MKRIKELISNERSQYFVYAGLSFVVISLTGIIYFSGKPFFQPYLGKINPLIAVLVSVFLGAIFLSFFLYRGWFAIYKKENLKGLLYSSCIAVLLVTVVILIDIKVNFPIDMNVLFPGSLLFYPAIEFFVEILFHVLPLALLLIMLTPFFNNINY